MKKYIFVFTMIIIVTAVFANPFKPNLMMPSLINMSKLSMHHSVSFSSGLSSDHQSFYQSKYTNHLQYQFNPKLSLSVDLNFMNYGTATFDDSFNIEGNNDNQTRVLPEFSLKYSPSENTQFIIEFKHVGGYDYYNNYRNWWE